MDSRLEQRALVPRYTVSEAAALVGRPPETIARWSFGHDRRYRGRRTTDEPLIQADGERGAGKLALSFLNLLELRMLSGYRDGAALQPIRRALAYVGAQLGVERPLIHHDFHVTGGELLTRFAEIDAGEDLLVNASREGQLTSRALAESVAWTEQIDYEDERIAQRWWFRTRDVPVLVDTRVAAGQPITAQTGVAVGAIWARHREGYSKRAIERDTGATQHEVDAVLAA